MIVNKVLEEAFKPFKGKDVVLWTNITNEPYIGYVNNVFSDGINFKHIDRHNCIVKSIHFKSVMKIRELLSDESM